MKPCATEQALNRQEGFITLQRLNYHTKWWLELTYLTFPFSKWLAPIFTVDIQIPVGLRNKKIKKPMHSKFPSACPLEEILPTFY